MERQIVVDNLGRSKGFLPRYFRGPAGNFEAGPRDAEGIRHIQGIYHIERIRVLAPERGQLSAEELYGIFPTDWI